MKDNKLLKETVVKTTLKFGIHVEYIQQREDWKEAKELFIDMVQEPMVCLKDFGFTDGEIQKFLRATEKGLPTCLALVVMKKAIDGCHNMGELKESFLRLWFDQDVLNELVGMASAILDDYFIMKGGTVF